MNIKLLLCKFGFHNWSKVQSIHNFSSNVIDYKKFCRRCGIQKTWTEPI
ncbi:MAG: hypothetical protein QXF15_03010 [Candidatus Aenigmatarchaeota archaeon]|nr:hypothetical protein [Candidatus Aenigmarchaeota archaeon]